MDKEENFLARVREEREVQKRLWPEPHDTSHSFMEWSAILATYLGRYSDEACNAPGWINLGDGTFIPSGTVRDREDSLASMESALVKLAAVAMACYEKL